MSAPHDVVDRLERLAAHAPGQTVEPDALWSRGRRRRWARAGAAATALLAAAAVGVLSTPLLLDGVQRIDPARSVDGMVLPALIRQPGAWEPAFETTPTRLSAVGVGTRNGLWSSRTAWWGVSAATGESRFLELPGAATDVGGEPALSADGRRLAYWITGEVDGTPIPSGAPSSDAEPVVGVAVLDLETGERDEWTIPSEHGLWANDIAWSGAVLWWTAGPVRMTSDGAYAARSRTRTWDVVTGRRADPTSATGRLVGVNAVGDGADGFAVQGRQGRLVYVARGADPVTLRLTMPADAPAASGTTDPAVSPDGSRVALLQLPDANRYDEAPKTVLVGEVAGRDVTLAPVDGSQAQALLGWRSATDLVVAGLDDVEEGRPQRVTRAWALDVATGDRTALVDFSGNTPRMAASAWTAEVVPAPAAPFAPDPRLVGLVVLVGALASWRVVVAVRRRRGRS